MKLILFFILLTLVVYGFRTVLTKRERRRTLNGARAWIIPLLVAAAITGVLLFVSLNFNGKVI